MSRLYNSNTLHTQMTTDDDNYLAYSRNVANILKNTFTYRPMAYASEVGESLRPVTKQFIVRGAYALSFGYVFTDIGIKTHAMKHLGNDAMVKNAIDLTIWHGLASMAIPAFTIHTIVKYSSVGLKHFPKVYGTKYGKFLPSILGLVSIPFIIHPIDHMTDYAMDNTIRKYYKTI